jgi:hypothetical protein
MKISERIYRTLLNAYPEGYLRRYKDPMTQLFSDQLREANTSPKLVRLWFRTLADLLRSVPASYCELEQEGAFRQLNESSRRSVFFARYAAEGLLHSEITPEDLLMGILRENRDIRAWLSTEALAEIGRALGGPRPRNRSMRRHVPISVDCKRILKGAQEEMERTGARRVSPYHLITALVRDNSTLAAQVLLRHGIGPRLRSEE